MDHIIREAIEIEHHPNNMDREDSFLSEQVMKTSHLLPEGL
jgi:hypothetical protein